ncbi:MAG: hypothetical protein NBV61_08740, partial [Algoriphagus sp.]|nr:hypothetical protein [Algoriphagus sp.]
MKRNNPRKPFLGSDKKEGDASGNRKPARGSSYSKRDSSSETGKGKFFGKKDSPSEKKPYEKRNSEGAPYKGASKGRF